MPVSTPSLQAFLAVQPQVVRIRLSDVRGSSPRDAGAEMFAAPTALWGTIGGGQLEYLAIEAARDMLRSGVLNHALDVPLGPEIGQCCGGRVTVRLSRMRASDKASALTRAAESDASLPHVYVMGAGHVGRALASFFQHLPVNCVLTDTRAEEIALCSADVECRVNALPEIDIRMAPQNSAFIVLTHDHSLDFLLTAAALERGDAAYVGMIGSATKRAKFRNWALRYCDGQSTDGLTCPIGASASRDKRPCIIATFVVAEVMAALTSGAATEAPAPTYELPRTGINQHRKGVPA